MQKVASDQVLPRPVRPEPVSGRPGPSAAPRDAFEKLLGAPTEASRPAARPERASRASSRDDQPRPADDRSAPRTETRRGRNAAGRDSAPPPQNNATKTAAPPATRQAKNGQPADPAEPAASEAAAPATETATAPEQAVQQEFLALVETAVVVAEGDGEPVATEETEAKAEEVPEGGTAVDTSAVSTEIAAAIPADVAAATPTPIAVALPTAAPANAPAAPTTKEAELAIDPQAAAPATVPADGAAGDDPADAAAPAKAAPDAAKPDVAAKTAPTPATETQKPELAGKPALTPAASADAPAHKPQAEHKTADATKAKSEPQAAKPASHHAPDLSALQAAANGETGDGKTPAASHAKAAETAPAAHAASAEARSESAAPAPTAPVQTATAPVSANPPISPLGLLAPTLLPTMSSLTALRVERPADNAIPVSGLAVEIVARANEGSKRFEIRLDPPELGRIEVRLDVDQAGKVSSRLVVDRTETLDLLRRDAHQLERALQHAGLNTEGGLEFSLRDQSFANRDQSSRDGGGNRSHLVIPDEEPAAAEAARRGYGRMIGMGSGVDIRV